MDENYDYGPVIMMEIIAVMPAPPKPEINRPTMTWGNEKAVPLQPVSGGRWGHGPRQRQRQVDMFPSRQTLGE